MKTFSAIFEVSDLKKFLRLKKDSISKTSHQELLVAIFLAKFHSKSSSEEYKIGIPVKRRLAGKLPDTNTNDQIEYLIKNWEDKDSPIDFSIIADRDYSIPENRIGFSYQLKGFPSIKNGSDITNNLLFYLKEKIPKKYAHTQGVGLLVMIGADIERIDFANLSKKLLAIQEYPFGIIVLICRDKSNLVFYEVWPDVRRFDLDPLRLLE